MSYITITDKDKAEMLGIIGISSIDDLFLDIPDSIRLKKLLDLPEPLSEMEIYNCMNEIGALNKSAVSFIGAGAYDHYIPAVVDSLSSRSEFYTAYTPYQAEVSQGTLVAIFEYQTMISRLTGLDIANASMYDGATAMAESVFMSMRSNGKKRVLVSSAVHPHYRDVLKTYCWASDSEYREIRQSDGTTDANDLDSVLDSSVSCVVVQNPNFFGCIEDVQALSDLIHRKNAFAVVAVTEPVSLGILKNPGSLGADIVCGEGQGFGNPIGFGGPMLGFLSAKKDFMRKMPGRLVGKTVDLDGNEAYVLTLQAREQHIRRDRATSNICTNQGLCALRAVIYLSLIGNRLREIAILNHRLAAYLKHELEAKGFRALFSSPYFNEFSLHHEKCGKILNKMISKGFMAGLDLSQYYPEYKNSILICATEKNSVKQIDEFVSFFEDNA